MKKSLKRYIYHLAIKRDRLEGKWKRSKYFDGLLDAYTEVLDKLQRIIKIR